MNGGIVAVAIVALPVYFVRTRGWKRGAVATLLALAVFLVLLGLSELGEWIGELFT
jgi:Na+/H+ antiporter NhaD/arsenite permease-like protein